MSGEPRATSDEARTKGVGGELWRSQLAARGSRLVHMIGQMSESAQQSSPVQSTSHEQP